MVKDHNINEQIETRPNRCQDILNHLIEAVVSEYIIRTVVLVAGLSLMSQVSIEDTNGLIGQSTTSALEHDLKKKQT
ncbi:hypothetical protein J1614_000688 [Plenodomus biglobosus]|nr:hypothetical protein J1614_000688 [Plenodomus biglobosus]